MCGVAWFQEVRHHLDFRVVVRLGWYVVWRKLWHRCLSRRWRWVVQEIRRHLDQFLRARWRDFLGVLGFHFVDERLPIAVVRLREQRVVKDVVFHALKERRAEVITAWRGGWRTGSCAAFCATRRSRGRWCAGWRVSGRIARNRAIR